MVKANSMNLVALVLWALLVIAVVLTTGCMADETAAPDLEAPIQIIETITPQEAIALIENHRDNPEFAIIDVRTPEEFAEGHIENAINIDFYSKAFRNDLDKLDKDRTYLIYCRTGRRSGLTIPMMRELDFMEVYDMLGGITRWRAEGLPTTR
ncbi:MAG: putative adenylyltransferase/sulfurtransferase MoeZ [Dehalococcoidia bacterium]|nr:putative adenylyltransferase/sulfurtransferase MoeZ [Chloroflexota bacterium]